MTSAEAPPLNAPARAELSPLADTAMLMDYAGNHPGKLATIIALSTFPGDGFATHAEVINRLNSIQGEDPGWDFTDSRSLPAAYCRKSLAPAGLVEFGTKVSVKGVPVEAVRLTPTGLTEGIMLAGALIPFDATAPEGTSLQEAMGGSQQQRVLGNGEPSRLAMYRTLLDAPRGVVAGVDLQRATGLSQGTASSIVKELDTAGIFSSIERSAPANRLFHLAEPPQSVHNLPIHTRGDTLAIIKAAMQLRAHGKTQATGAEILEMSVLPAGSDPGVAWGVFTRWLRESNNSFLTEQTPHDNIALRTRIAITRTWRPFLRELLRVRQLLAEGAEDAANFRANALAYGQDLVNHPKILATVLARAEAYSRRGSDDWLDHIAGFVPDEGIAAPELHRIATAALGAKITYKKFRKRLGRAATLTITEQQGGGSSGNSISYVTPPPRFAADWTNDAACRGQDPDLFYPEGIGEAAVAQAQAAQRICNGCVVELACLKTALTERVKKFGVSGGVWWDRKHRPGLTPDKRRAALAVRIDAQPKRQDLPA
ncbi:MAG TPA: WhiB family transcriptional regulator [Candidatus Saccharimonadales bacterium]|nr:WhiB family transcriptional regulator [Candidatus Saccharimonadales bacterium]